jgi:adenosylhomocysteine nucleosidase
VGDVTLGIVCGLKSEADALAIPGVAVSGARPDVAERQAARLAEGGATALLSIGLAGALAPGLRPGDLLVPEAILAAGTRYPADAALGSRLGFPLQPTALAGADTVIASPAGKARLHQQTGAAAVDMESHRVARVAAARSLPFLAIRIIADPAGRAIPSAADGAVRADGSVDVLKTLIRLAIRPWQLPALITLGRDSAKAHAQLEDVGRSLRRAGA